jgi:predicted SprT family Zn-dependent metalloprotease
MKKFVKVTKAEGKIRPKAFRRELKHMYYTCDECGTKRKVKRMWKEAEGSIVDCLVVCPSCAKKLGGR